MERAFQGKEFWKNYMHKWYGEDLIAKSNVIEEDYILSEGTEIHLDVYPISKERPTVVFCHGLVGYGRVMLPFTIPLYELGYNVVAPDLMGYGNSKGKKGDFTWNHWLANLRDCVSYARGRLGDDVILSGASMGGPLAYAAAARHWNVDAVICYCLWDLQMKEFIEGTVNFGKWTYLVLQLFKMAAKIAPRYRIKNSMLISYAKLTDSDEMNHMLEFEDPLSCNVISVRAAVSLITQSKLDIPPEKFPYPTLVVYPSGDRMANEEFAKRMYKALTCDKRIVPFEGSDHFTTHRHYFEDVWGPEADVWIKEHVLQPSSAHDAAGRELEEAHS